MRALTFLTFKNINKTQTERKQIKRRNNSPVFSAAVLWRSLLLRLVPNSERIMSVHHSSIPLLDYR